MSTGIYTNTGYHNRRSIRLRGYDYSQPGLYYITTCIDIRQDIALGTICNDAMALNEYGEIIRDGWNGLTDHFENIRLDEFIVMPDHFHGIIEICGAAHIRTGGVVGPDMGGVTGRGGVTPPLPTTPPLHVNPPQRDTGPRQNATLGQMVAYFKYQTTKTINAMRSSGVQKIWQRNYYDRIIRDDITLSTVRQYIRKNPLKWRENSKTHLDAEILEFGNIPE